MTFSSASYFRNEVAVRRMLQHAWGRYVRGGCPALNEYGVPLQCPTPSLVVGVSRYVFSFASSARSSSSYIIWYSGCFVALNAKFLRTLDSQSLYFSLFVSLVWLFTCCCFVLDFLVLSFSLFPFFCFFIFS